MHLAGVVAVPRTGVRRRHLRLALFRGLRLALTLLHLLLGAVAVVVTRASLGLILLLRPRPVLLGPRL